MLPPEWQEKLPECQVSVIKVETTLNELLDRSRLDPKQTAIAEEALQYLQKANERLMAIEPPSGDPPTGSRPQLVLLLGGLSDPDGDVPFG